MAGSGKASLASAAVATSSVPFLASTLAASSFFAVTGVTDVQASMAAGFGVTSGVTSAVTDVTARPSNLASSASSPMIYHQLVGEDGVQAHQASADA